MSSALTKDISLTSEIQSHVVTVGEEARQNVLVTVRLPAAPHAPKAGLIVVVGELSEAWSHCLEEPYESVETMTKAINHIVEAKQGGISAAAIIMAPHTDIQDTRGLIKAIESLNQVEMPLFVLSFNSRVDHRLLSQFAILSGGAYGLLKKPTDWHEGCQSIIETVRSGLGRFGFLTVEAPAMMDIEAFYTVHPQPGLVQLSTPDAPRRSLSFPLLQSNSPREQRFLLTIRTPRLQEGVYGLANIACRAQLDEEEASLAEHQVEFVVEKPSLQGSFIRPSLVSVHQKLQLNTMLELMAQSYLREDGSGISRILDSLERELLLLGALESAATLAKLRVDFLHRGSFALPQLNTTWRIIYQASNAWFQRT